MLRTSIRLFPLVVLVAAIGMLAAVSPSATQAANGDNLRTIIADRTGTSCASYNQAGNHGGVGVGIAFDGTNLLISCYNDSTVTEIDPADGSQEAPPHFIAGANSLGALAYNGTAGVLYGCSGFSSVGIVDLTLNTFTYLFTATNGCFDGLAYDGTDNTIWASGDAVYTTEHYTITGAPLGAFNNSLGNCGNSGIAVGGANLYLANNGCSEIYTVSKDFTSSVLFASFPARLEDLECDNLTFAGQGKGAIWSTDAYDNILNAWEIAPGLCTFGGGGEQECPTCNQNVITVDEDVTVDLNPAVPTCNDGVTDDLCLYFSFDKTGTDASKWKAIFNVGESKLIIKDNATVSTVSVPYAGTNRKAPGIEIVGSCELFIEGDLDNNGEPGGIVVTSYNLTAGDIVVKFDGNINIDGRVINQVLGTLGYPGKITIAACCGDITTGPKSRIETIGVDPGGSDINILTCCERGYGGDGGDILIQGMVHAIHKQGKTPTINIVSFAGGITIVGTNDFGEETVAGTKVRRTSGVLVETTGATVAGDINIQGHDAVNVIGNTILNKNRIQYGAVAIKSKNTNGQGGDGDMTVISTNGGIRATDRAFDFENRFNALNAITLRALNDITLAVTASVNNGAADNTKAVVSSQGGQGGAGGTNTLRSYCGAINILPKAQDLANAPGGSPGINLLTASTGVNNAGTVNPADANPGDDNGPCDQSGPPPIFLSCAGFGINFARDSQ